VSAEPSGLPRAIGTLVIGGGILGLCAAGFLAAEGADVALVDDGRIGGSTANAGSLHVQLQSRFMRLYPAFVPRLEAMLHFYPKAVTFWQALQRDLGADFDLKMTGGLMIAEDRDQFAFLAGKARRERELGLEVDMLDRAALDRIAPYFGPSVVGAEICVNEGKLNPLLANAAIRRWVSGLGVMLVEHCAVRRLERAGAGFVVTCDGGVIRAGRVVLAAASGCRALAATLGIPIAADPEPLHMNITEPASPLIGHLVQHADRPITLKQFGTGQVVIGGGWAARLAGERQHPTVILASLIGNVSLAQHIVPAIAPLRVIRTWAGVNTTVDGAAVLGPVSAAPSLFVAIPGDAGYTLGPFSAKLVAETVLGRKPSEDLSTFSPDRFASTA
jgi:glycine/D-amino acid oxidase-like deaminating enzyme